MHAHTPHMCTHSHARSHTNTCVHTPMHTHTHIYTNVCHTHLYKPLLMCTHPHLCTHPCTYAHPHMCTHTHAQSHPHNAHTPTLPCMLTAPTCGHIPMHAHTRTHVHTHPHMCTPPRTFAHTHPCITLFPSYSRSHVKPGEKPRHPSARCRGYWQRESRCPHVTLTGTCHRGVTFARSRGADSHTNGKRREAGFPPANYGVIAM